jgi:hypothetical protein
MSNSHGCACALPDLHTQDYTEKILCLCRIRAIDYQTVKLDSLKYITLSAVNAYYFGHGGSKLHPWIAAVINIGPTSKDSLSYGDQRECVECGARLTLRTDTPMHMYLRSRLDAMVFNYMLSIRDAKIDRLCLEVCRLKHENALLYKLLDSDKVYWKRCSKIATCLLSAVMIAMLLAQRRQHV